MKRRISPVRWGRLLALWIAFFCTVPGTIFAVIHLDTGDPTLYTSTPGDNSGWQYEGQFGGLLWARRFPRTIS